MMKRWLYKIGNPIRRRILKVFCIKTIGARALVVDQGRVLLIRHTYQKGWYTIGGAVNQRETPCDAVVRELWEEVGLVPLKKPELFALYHNQGEKRDDYVALYIVREFDVKKHDLDCPEIADKQWFLLKDLPPDVTPATQRRIEEFLGFQEISDKW